VGKKGASPPTLAWFPSVSQPLISSAPDVQHGAVNGFVLNVSSDVIESSLSCSGTKAGVMLSAVSQPGLDPSGTDEPVIVVSYE
jgi:hypothetical protein